jgi:hypothetical protein
MKLLLRVIAVWNGLAVLVTILLLTHIIGRASSPATSLLLIGLAVTVPLGVYGSVQLWRLRQGGRYATLALFGLWGALTIAGIVMGQSASSGDVLRLVAVAATGCILLLPAAARACA